MQNEEVGAAAARMSEHAKTLRDGAAPHQQSLANDLKLLVEAVSSTSMQTTLDELALANTTIENMKGQLTKAREERDKLRDRLAAVEREREKAHDEIETLNQSIVELQEQVAAHETTIANQEKEHVESTKLGIHSATGETHVDLKAKSKASNADKPGVVGVVGHKGKH